MAAAPRTVLITGASGGIGQELARTFARHGHSLILAARSEQQLRALADELRKTFNVSASVLTADLGQPGAADKIAAELSERQQTVDILVNNAGFANYGYFAEIETEKELQLLQVNIVALTHLTKLLLPGMKARGYGKILNVASTAAFMPGPLMAAYYASKAYVLSLSEALAEELKGTGVTVTALCPGPTASGFQKRAAMEDSKLVQNGLMDAATVADAGYDALMADRVIVVPGMINRIQSLLPRFLPRSLIRRTVINAQGRVGH